VGSLPSGAMPNAAIPRFMSPGYAIAFVTVTAAGVMQAASAPAVISRRALAVVVVMGAIYAALGTLVLGAVERRGSRAALRGVFVALLALGIAATVVSAGHATMLLLAVVSASVIYLDARGGAAACLLCGVVALVAFAVRLPLGAALVQAEVTFGSGIAFVIVFSRLVRRERRARAEVERLAAEVEQLATERERNRIARDIHDGLGHYLTVAHVQLEAAQTLLAGDPVRARAALDTAQRLTRDGLAEVRRSVTLLRGAPIRPLIDAIETLARESAAPVAGGVRVEGAPRRLAEPVEFALFRAAQEALTNARRHARASHVDITLVFTEAGVVRLRVGDDGVGDDGAGASVAAPGFGLLGLRERAELVGGTLSITTGRDRGFTLELAVPG
jgi:signal transduction histidine kinase